MTTTETVVNMPVAFNVNHRVKIRLTDVGRQYLHEHGHDWKLTPGYSTAEESDGTSTWQLWELMHVFGAALYMGCRPPFELNIVLLPEA